MELIEFEIGDSAPGAPCCGNAVAAGTVGVCRVAIGFARAACREHHGTRANGLYGAVNCAEQISATGAVARFDDINQTAIREQGDVLGFDDPAGKHLG